MLSFHPDIILNIIYYIEYYIDIELYYILRAYPLDRFFKKREKEKRLRRPQGDEDNESVEDVDDEEFEKILGKCMDQLGCFECVLAVFEKFCNC